ncbi:MAG TPA: sialidase family protein [Candidatus Brocadiaceae bacterium]|nr:sialidase family protein [Candidatus Brocadiaceae bacterium]
MNHFSHLCRQFKVALLPITFGSALLASSSVMGDELFDLAGSSSSHYFPSKRHSRYFDLRAKQTFPSKVNPTVDFLLQNANLAIADLYAPLLPDLSRITGQYNSYSSSLIIVNPQDKKNLLTVYRQDGFSQKKTNDGQKDYGGLGNAGPQVAVSFDSGNSWSYTIPAKPTWLYGTLGQVVGSANYPISFSKNGTIFFMGGYDQTRPLLPIPGASSGIYVVRSFDKGLTWTDPVILDTDSSGAFQLPSSGGPDGQGIADQAAGGILVDTQNDRFIHVGFSKTDHARDTLYGNIWYARSTDHGDSWEPAKLIYEMTNDTKWVQEHGWVNNDVEPPVPLGGQALGGTLVSVPAKNHENSNSRKQTNVLLAGFSRYYPKQGATTYFQGADDTDNDHAVVRSFDNGETWTAEGATLPQFVYAFAHDPRTSGESTLTVTDGGTNSIMAVSPKTNRVYFAWQAGNTAVSSDTSVSQFFPIIQISSSADAGETWSSAATASRTPFNSTIMNANQSFNQNIAFLDDGLLGIIYADFRNYDGGQVTANCDMWLAIYRETKSPHGGSSGIGLDFVTEVRLIPQSFDAGISGIGSQSGIAASGNTFLTTFPITNQGNLPSVSGPYGMTQDLNNRINVFFEKVLLEKRQTGMLALPGNE